MSSSTDLIMLTVTGFYSEPAKSYQFFSKPGWWVANQVAGHLLLMGVHKGSRYPLDGFSIALKVIVQLKLIMPFFVPGS